MTKTVLNPFENFTERKLLLVSLFGFLVAWLATYYSDTMLLGSLKVINVKPKEWYIALYNLSITIVVNTLTLYFFALLRYRKTRLIDVFNAVGIAHLAMYLLLVVSAIPSVTDFLKSMEFLVLDHMDNPASLPKDKILLMLVFGVFSIGCLVLFFTILVKGMKIAINSKKGSDTIAIVLLILIWNTVLQFLNIYQ